MVLHLRFLSIPKNCMAASIVTCTWKEGIDLRNTSTHCGSPTSLAQPFTILQQQNLFKLLLSGRVYAPACMSCSLSNRAIVVERTGLILLALPEQGEVRHIQGPAVVSRTQLKPRRL